MNRLQLTENRVYFYDEKDDSFSYRSRDSLPYSDSTITNRLGWSLSKEAAVKKRASAYMRSINNHLERLEHYKKEIENKENVLKKLKTMNIERIKTVKV